MPKARRGVRLSRACLAADTRAKEVLEAASRSGAKISDDDLLSVLKLWNFRKNRKRVNVMSKGQVFVYSEMLGLVRIRAFNRLVLASQSRLYPSFTRILCQFLHDNPPEGLQAIGRGRAALGSTIRPPGEL